MRSTFSFAACLLTVALMVAGTAGAASPPSTRITLTLNEGSWMNVDVSPDGKLIAFDLLNDIFVMPAAGGQATLMHGGSAAQRSPRFSPDGKRLAFISDESGADNVWTSSVDGADKHQVTRETRDMIMGPAWAPDGRTIAATKVYGTFEQMKASEIWSFPVDGAAPKLIVEVPPSKRDVQEARYAPDGSALYYTERLTTPNIYVDANHINYAIKQRRLADNDTKTLLAGFGGATTAQISPNSELIAFVRRVRAKTVLFVYDVKTRTQRAVYDDLERDLQATFTPDEHYYPAFGWFPDNRSVAVWGKGKLKKVDVVDGTVADIPFRATAIHEIRPAVRFRQDIAPAAFKARAIRHIAPSPDNKSLVFRAVGHLWLQDGRGAPRRLTSSALSEHDPSWSRDGTMLVYVAWQDETGSAIVVRRMSDGTETIVHRSPGIVRQPRLSPDGAALIFRVDEPDKDLGGQRAKPGLYVMPVKGGEPVYVAGNADAPQFSPDGGRINFVARQRGDNGSIQILRSANRDGSDVRDLARTENPDTNMLRLSPDQRWLAYKQLQQCYVTLLPDGTAPLVISEQDNGARRKLTDVGCFEPAWTATASTLTWMLGAERFEATAADNFSPRSRGSIDLTVKTDVPQGIIAFVGGRVLTMKDNDQVFEKGTVIVDGARIVAVGAADRVKVPTGAFVVDAAGKTIMPGIFDAHGHIDCCAENGVVPEKQPQLYAALAFGVTSNFDPYSRDLSSYETTDTTMAGVNVGPRWMNSGGVIYGRAHKGDLTYNPIAGEADALNIMRRKHAVGGRIIKSYKQPARQARQNLVEAGRKIGIMVDVEGEANYTLDITAIIDGHSNLEHNLPIANYYDDVISLFAAGKTSTTPTLVVAFGELFGENFIYQTHAQSWTDPKARTFIQKATSSYSPLGIREGAPPYARAMTSIHVADELWDVGFRSVARSIKKLDDRGVLINVGSHGEQAGLAAHWEMELLSQGGMAPMRILRAATINAARSYGMEKDLGSLEPGKLADIIVLDKDPLADIRNSNSVRYTMINGRLYDSATMDEIGNRPKPRSKFFWELGPVGKVDWSEAWSWD